jgi:hypothetical protein
MAALRRQSSFRRASALEQNFLPRERVTVLIARKDGAGTRAVFTGCLPFFSLAERTKINRDSGYRGSIDTFFGTGPVANAKKGMDLFRIRIGDGFQEALQLGVLSAASASGPSSDIAKSGLVSSLKQGNLLNLNYGIPRVVLYSDLTRFFGNAEPGAKGRQLGLDKGLAANLNFRNAELYVAGMSGGAGARDALDMFFLAAHAELAGAGSASSLPGFAGNPVHVSRFQGTIQWAAARSPVRIRLATDQNGTVVNSWLSVNTDVEQFSPFHGVLTCASETSCKFTGDEMFSQVWTVSRSANGVPALNAQMPFGGARTLDFTVENSVAKGAISDPNINFQGTKNNRLEFSASRQAAALF